MTKSQNTKNEHQKDLCITSEQLTEQWKKGELPNGWYWVKGIKSEGIYAYTAEYLNNMYRPRNGEIIIEQVPSYEEWIGVKQQRDLENKLRHDSDNKNWQLRTENQQLKELLKECRPALVRFVSYDDSEENARILLMNKINEVLK